MTNLEQEAKFIQSRILHVQQDLDNPTLNRESKEMSAHLLLALQKHLNLILELMREENPILNS